MNHSLPAFQHLNVFYGFVPAGNLFLRISLVLLSLQSVTRVARGVGAYQYLSYVGHSRKEMQEVSSVGTTTIFE